MGALFEFKGIVKKVNPIQRFESGFEKRELVLTDDIGTVVNWPNTLCFVFKKERMHFLEGIFEGMRVKVVFAIDCKEWTDGNGKTRYFTDLTGIKLEVLQGTDGQAPAANSTDAQPQQTPPETPPADDGSDDLPF